MTERLRVVMELDDKGFVEKVTTNAKKLDKLSSSTDRLGTQMGRTIKKTKTWLTTLKDTSLTIASLSYVVPNLTNVLFGWQRGLISANAELERSVAIMKNFSTENTKIAQEIEARGFVDILTEKAAKAPFSINAITDTFVKMKATGLDPLAGGMNALVDSVAAFGGTDDVLKRATVAISQIAGKGVLSMEELRQQLGEAVPTAIQMLARSLNTTYGDLVKQISLGNVDAKPALVKMFEQMEIEMGGAAERMMGTWGGLIAQIQTQATVLAREMGETEYFDALKTQLKGLLDLMKSNRASQFAADMGKSLAGAVEVLREAFDGLAKYKGVVTDIIKVLGGMAKIVLEVFKVIEQFGPALLRLATAYFVATKAMKLFNFTTGKASAVRGYFTTVADGMKKATAQYKSYRNAEANIRNSAEKMNEIRRITAAETKRVAMANNVYRKSFAGLNKQELAYQKILIEKAVLQEANIVKTKAQTFAINSLKMAYAALPTVAIPMIGLMVAEWLLGKDAIQENIDKLIEYNGLNASREQLDSARAKIEELKEKEKELNKDINEAAEDVQFWNKLRQTTSSSVVKGMLVARTSELSNLKENLKETHRQLKVLENTLEAGSDGYIEDKAKASLNAYRRNADRELIALQAEFKKFSKEMIEAQKNQTISVEEAKKRSMEAYKKFYEGRIALVQKSIDTENAISEKANEEDLEKSKRVIAALLAELKKYQDKIKNYKALSVDEILLEGTGSKKGAEKLDKIDSKLLSLSGTLEKLKNASSVTGGEYEKFLGQLGDTSKMKNSEERLKKIKQLMTEIEEAKKQQKVEKDNQATLDKVSKKILSVTAAIAEFENRSGSSGGAYEKFLATLGDTSNIEGLDELLEQLREKMTSLSQKNEISELEEAVSKLSDTASKASEKSLLLFSANQEQTLFKMSSATANYNGQVQLLTEQLDQLKGTIDEVTYAQMKAALANVNKNAETVNMVNLYSQATKKSQELSKQLTAETDSKGAYYENLIANTQKMINSITGQTEAHLQAKEALRGYLTLLKQAASEENQSAISEHIQDWNDLATSIDNVAINAIDGFANSLGDALATGKVSFSDFAESVIKDITRMIAKLMIYRALTAIMGGFSTGGKSDENGLTLAGATKADFYAKGGIAGQSSGGIAHSPQMAIFGEGRLPEAYVPLPDGRTIPVTLAGNASSGGGVKDVKVQIFNQSGQQMEGDSKSRFDGEKMIVDVVLKNISKPSPMRDAVRSVR